jgi:uracil-DNA glycosylase
MQARKDSLQKLHRRMRSCRLCLEQGHDVQPPAIFSGGLGARLMLIGQAPGITEVEADRPFNAGSGSRLFQWLGEAGLEETWFRKSQYMTAVTKCFPGKAKNGSGDRVPTRAEQILCRPYLDEEIALIDPILILPVGRLAINLFFPAKQALSQFIGDEFQIDNRWVIPLPHPSGASRWHQSEENRLLIQKAIETIHRRCDKMQF